VSDSEKLISRELNAYELTDFPVGTLKLGETEHGCCHEAAIRRLEIYERNDGSRRQVWNLVAEFVDEEDARRYIEMLQRPRT